MAAGRKAREKATEAKALSQNGVASGGSSDASVQKLAREILHKHDDKGCATASGESMGSVVVPASPAGII
uniref:Uncharacterized protein n=1 Tax=Zea mays TaxID=4577 RepID=B6TC38_MAIZE|nr:hypothetical protein [Zea mays]